MKKKYLPYLLLFLIIACAKDRAQLQMYSDPYANSFRGKNIKYMFSYDTYDSSLIVDTTVFDISGNLIEIKQGFGNSKFAYDSLNFLIKSQQRSDVTYNFIIKYYFNKQGALLQEWDEIKYSKWPFYNPEIKRIFNVVKFEIDLTGRIIQEIDSLREKRVVYAYDSGGDLIRKNLLSLDSMKSHGQWIYIYDSDKIIKNIRRMDNKGSELLGYYFSDGLLDSSVRADFTTIKYKYNYWSQIP